MNDTPTSRHATDNRLRQALIDAIVFRTEQELEDAIPPEIPKESRKAIVEELLSNSRFVMGKFSLEQLQDDSLLDRHIEGAVASAEYLVSRIQAQRSRS